MGRILVAVAAIAFALFFRNIAQDYPRAAARLPTILANAVVLLAVIGIGAELLKWRRQASAGTLHILPTIDGKAIGIGVAFVALTFVYAASIQVLGYLISTLSFLLISFFALRPMGAVAMGLSAVAVTVCIWAVFIYFLGLPLPILPGA